MPAFNAAATIARSLDSVCVQTHRALEIIVVDDGSKDDTPDIVAEHARADPRVRLLRQANAGVAAARNAAIAAAQGAFIAPIDADDLWHPQKIEKQLAAMHQGGDRIGLVYTWSALIDADCRVIALGPRSPYAGNVLRRLCHGNFVGNGSSPLMRTAAVQAAGGYDVTLRQRAAEGCEDFRLYLGIAERFDFAVVPEYLTGYRQLPTSMSNDVPQMLRSFNLVEDELLARRPEFGAAVRDGKANALYGAYLKAKQAGNPVAARAYARQLIRSLPYHAFKAFVYRPLRDGLLRPRLPPPPTDPQGRGQRFPWAAGADAARP